MKEKIKKKISGVWGSQVKRERLTLLIYGAACSIWNLVFGDQRLGSFTLVFTLGALFLMWLYGEDPDILGWLKRLKKRGGSRRRGVRRQQ